MSESSCVIDGRWQLLRAEFGGETAPAEVAAQTVFEFVDGEYRVHFGREVVDRGTFALAAATVRDSLVLHGKSGHNAGRTIPCLLQIRGDRLRICFGLDGVAPAGFATTTTDQRYLATYRRVTTSS